MICTPVRGGQVNNHVITILYHLHVHQCREIHDGNFRAKVDKGSRSKLLETCLTKLMSLACTCFEL